MLQVCPEKLKKDGCASDQEVLDWTVLVITIIPTFNIIIIPTFNIIIIPIFNITIIPIFNIINITIFNITSVIMVISR